MLQTLLVSLWLKGWYPLHWGRRRNWSDQKILLWRNNCDDDYFVRFAKCQACLRQASGGSETTKSSTDEQAMSSYTRGAIFNDFGLDSNPYIYRRNGRHSLTLLNIDTNSIGEYKWALENLKLSFCLMFKTFRCAASNSEGSDSGVINLTGEAGNILFSLTKDLWTIPEKSF